MHVYKLTVGITYIYESGFVKTYGIIGREGNKSIHIKDISNDRSKVEELVKLLNDNDVALVHFSYIVEEWILK